MWRNITALLLAILGAASAAASFDIAILNGRVMDPESGFDAIRNVGVADGRIATITEQVITGKETIDADCFLGKLGTRIRAFAQARLAVPRYHSAGEWTPISNSGPRRCGTPGTTRGTWANG